MPSTICKKLENFSRLPLARKFLAIVIIIVILLMAEMFPRYISLPIHSPDYATGNKFDDWTHVTHSVFTIRPGFLNGRVFIERKESFVLADLTTWNSVVDYFDQEMRSLGWIRDSTYARCPLYLPEAEFLPEGEGGIVHYIKIKRPLYLDNGLTCLAIWKQQENLKVVLLTARPSILTILWDIIAY